MIPEEGKIPYTGTIVDNTGAHKYTIQSRTQVINHVTTFKNVPTLFPMEPSTNTKLHRGSDYYVCIYLSKNSITVEPTASHIHCNNTELFWGYIYLV